jgi:hypothetical protein
MERGAMQPTIDADVGGRLPTWSGLITRPLASVIPPRWRDEALVAIKAIHTIIFASVFAAVLTTLWDGIRGAPRRRTGVAGGIVLTETALYLSNNQVCPLTPLAEEFGAARGSVVDMFLPAALARRTPLVAGSAAILALVLNLRALARRGPPRTR